MYIYIVIRGPQEHQSLTGSSIYTLRPSAATYYHNRIYTYVVYGAVSQTKIIIRAKNEINNAYMVTDTPNCFESESQSIILSIQIWVLQLGVTE